MRQPGWRCASANGKLKKNKYKELIDYSRYDFLPFILEVQGGIGDSARRFIEELEKRETQRRCQKRRNPRKEDRALANLDLTIAISIKVQRINAENIL